MQFLLYIIEAAGVQDFKERQSFGLARWSVRCLVSYYMQEICTKSSQSKSSMDNTRSREVTPLAEELLATDSC